MKPEGIAVLDQVPDITLVIGDAAPAADWNEEPMLVLQQSQDVQADGLSDYLTSFPLHAGSRYPDLQTSPVNQVPQSRREKFARRAGAPLLVGGLVVFGAAACASPSSAQPNAPASSNSAAYNPANCVTRDASGTETVNLTCAKKGFPAQLPTAIRRDERSVVSVAIGDTPNAKGMYVINYATGVEDGPDEALSAGHDLEEENSCDIKYSSVAAPSPDGAAVGITATPIGLSDGYNLNDGLSVKNTDVSTIYIGGPKAAEFQQVPAVNVATDAVDSLPAGTDVVILSDQAQVGGAQQESPASLQKQFQVTDAIEAVSVGENPKDPHDTDFADVGTYTSNQLPATIGGSSGGAIVKLNGKGVVTEIQVQGITTPDNDPVPINAATFWALTGVDVTQGGGPASATFLSVGQEIPVDASKTMISCGA